MRLKPLILIAVAFGLLTVGHSIGLRGDVAPRLPDGSSLEAAKYHVTALVFTIGALGCFIYAIVGLFRRR